MRLLDLTRFGANFAPVALTKRVRWILRSGLGKLLGACVKLCILHACHHITGLCIAFCFSRGLGGPCSMQVTIGIGCIHITCTLK